MKSWLMSFVDFANHHAGALGFATQLDKSQGQGIALNNSKPVPDTDEVFVQYQLFDAMDMYTIYGYVALPFICGATLLFLAFRKK